MRNDWASYLNSWVQTDIEIGAILKRLEDEGIADSTVVFFWTDHGVSHARGKQFLYEEGIRVPLIVRYPGNKHAGEVRTDLVTHIDIAASSLALAGIDIPKHIQGIDLFARDYRPRDMIFSARDRCDETVEIQRCVRTNRYKYIRNFLPHLPHLQPNQYKDGKAIIKTLRALHSEGKLNELQSRVLAIPRPSEELYDLENDPHETVNLAGAAPHGEAVKKLRVALYDWMVNSRDVGLILRVATPPSSATPTATRPGSRRCTATWRPASRPPAPIRPRFLDRTDLASGRSWVAQLQEGVAKADQLILVATPEALVSPRVEDEWEAFLTRRRDWARGSFHVAMLVDVPLPPFVDRIQRLDFV